ncbi:hypothetical protein [Streptococcus ovuberis]|nr:hypothetical protein [Streptococcus ovuberis]
MTGTLVKQSTAFHLAAPPHSFNCQIEVGQEEAVKMGEINLVD